MPFFWVARREIGSLDLLGVSWRPALATVAMAVAVWLASGWHPMLAIPAGALTYGVALLAVRALTPDEIAQARSLLRRRRQAGAGR